MRLRSKLFLSSSALMAVALFGLVIGLFGLLLLTGEQSGLLKRNLRMLEGTMEMRQEISNQILLRLDPTPDWDQLRESDRRFRAALGQTAWQIAADDDYLPLFEKLQSAYQAHRSLLFDPAQQAASLPGNALLTRGMIEVRDDLAALQLGGFRQLERGETKNLRRAEWFSYLLGVLGLGVLLVGFFTAHVIARRVAEPIEALARAADQIGQGQFRIVLPLTPVSELASLSQRFGLMAETLRQFKETNVEALLSSQRRLRALLDSIDDGLLIIDRRGCLEHCNPVAQRQLGWDSERLGLRLGEALGRPQLDEAVHQVLRNEPQAKPPEDLVIEVGGEQRLLAWHLSAVSHDDGRVLGAVMVLQDVTDQRAYERVRNEFVLRASHELRTPITGMHMAFGLLRERLRDRFAPDSRERELLDTLDQEMRRLVRLIEDLLNFSRYRSGQQQLERQPCDCAELLEHARQRFAGQAQSQGVGLDVELQPSLPRLSLDVLLMERLIDNLLGNALRHTSSGGQIRLLGRRHDGRAVMIGVQDSGEGIPYSQQARVFEPFVQVGRRQGGAGLGLALCKEIAQLHGGRLGVRSRPGQGTLFYVVLPI